MRIATVVRRLPWLVSLLAGCGDDAGGGGDGPTTSSGSTSTPMTTTGANASTSGSDDSTSDDHDSTGPADTTGVAESSRGDDGTTGTESTTDDDTTGTTTTDGTTGAESTTDDGTTGTTTTDGTTGAESTTDDGTTGTTTTDGTTAVTNPGPVAVDDVYFTSQNGELVVGAGAGVLANDSDPDGGPLTLVSADPVSAAGGTVVVADDGAVTYAPEEGYWGPDSFEYTVENDVGEAASATATVYVGPIRIPLSDVSAGMGGFVLDGEAEEDLSGWSVSGAGDVNGDGMGDLFVGALDGFPTPSNSGSGYVVFGKADTTAVEFSDIAAGMGGFVLDPEVAFDHSGFSVSDAGDVNGDGIDDLILGAERAPPNGEASGRSYVVFGKADTAAVELGDVTAGIGGFVLDGEAVWDLSGRSVSGAGDVNGDGMDDLIVGAFLADANGSASGRSYVVFGKADTSPVELSDVTAGMGGFVLDGEAAYDRSGLSVSGAGDVNGDGMDDLIIGAYGADPNGSFSGRSYVVFGRADTTAVDLSDVTAGLGGFVLDGEAAGDRSGFSVSGAGDVDGDGMADLIVGAPRAAPNGDASGRSYVVFGRADTTAVDLSDVTAGLGGFVLDGEAAGDNSGRSVSGTGDVNGDGMDDLIIGAYGAAPNGGYSGRSYVVFGKADTAVVELSAIAAGQGGFALDGETADDRSGFAVSGAGDVNGDGMDDLIIGAYGADPNGGYSGRSYVVFGVPTAGTGVVSADSAEVSLANHADLELSVEHHSLGVPRVRTSLAR